MCGIFFSLSSLKPVLPSNRTRTLLQGRGPDSFQTHTVELQCPRCDVHGSGRPETHPVYLTFVSTVLALRGNHLQPQPLVDAHSQSVLCWNGEAWKIAGEPICGNDTEVIFKNFLEATLDPPTENGGEFRPEDAIKKLTSFISSISGPFSFVFYDGLHSRLFFSRDCLGRRSLLQGLDECGNFTLCSIPDRTSSTSFGEVETDGLHMIDLTRLKQQGLPDQAKRMSFQVDTIPWSYDAPVSPTNLLKNPIPPMNRALPTGEPPVLTLDSSCVEVLEQKLRRALELRIRNVPQPPHMVSGAEAKIAVLFSGGLDCTVLARLAHDILPIDEPVDLLNVAFENPRVVAASAKDRAKKASSIYESCPDRITGRAGYAELQRTCPNRKWRFVAVNVPYSETLAHRDEVKRLMKPHNTEMDLSIACALYFASRGQGVVSEDPEDCGGALQYTTSARVLLSGLGADELFAGYTRHAAAFARAGFQGLIEEIDLDVGRLGKRNLGRDDRMISNWGREARYPYLDEEFVAWATRTPVWERCGFGTSQPVTSQDSADITADLEPGKKALRLLALKLDLNNVAREKKRAIQFGSRTAKMESGRSKGTHVLD